MINLSFDDVGLRYDILSYHIHQMSPNCFPRLSFLITPVLLIRNKTVNIFGPFYKKH